LTHSVAATITSNQGPFAGPYGLAISPGGSKLYVTHMIGFSNLVSVMSTVTNTELAAIPIYPFPKGISVTPDGSKVYVAVGAVHVISTATFTETASVTAGVNPIAFGNFILGASATPTVPALSNWVLVSTGLLLAALALGRMAKAARH
jgi:YVTN family beta-propeller protein